VTQPGVTPVVTGDATYYYQELTPHGRWLLLDDGTWSWQPRILISTPDWRPYWDGGHWVWTDQGWYWMSDYPWGGVTFHYGRWQAHPVYGWVWVPDRVWGPAWVVWRNSGDYYGWAPLPAGAMFDVNGGFFLYRGHRVAVGFDFGLGLNHFTFCLGREMGDPFPHHFHPGPEHRVIFERSVIVNRYTVEHGPGGNRIINHGFEPRRMNDVHPDFGKPIRVRDIRGPGAPAAHDPERAVGPKPIVKPAQPVPTPSRGGGGRPFGGTPGRDHDRPDAGGRH
jgi:hypothetical protein